MLKFIMTTVYGTALGSCFMAITVSLVDVDDPNIGAYGMIAFFAGLIMPFAIWADNTLKVRRMKEDARLEAELNKLRNA